VKFCKAFKSLSVFFCALLLCGAIASLARFSSAQHTPKNDNVGGTLRDPRLEPLGVMMGATRAIAANENVAAAISDSALVILDITDPAFPRILSHTPLPTYSKDMLIADNYAYVAWSDCDFGWWCERGGVQILDISVPTAPVLVGSLADSYMRNIAIFDSTLYANPAGKFALIDVSNPAEPYVSARIQFDDGYTYTSVREMQIHADDSGRIYAFVMGLNGSLYIVDVTDASSPTQIAAFKPPGSSMVDIALVDHGETLYAYLPDRRSSLRVVDVTNPASPTGVYTYSLDSPPYDITIKDHWALVATDKALCALDISDPGTLVTMNACAQTRSVVDMVTVGDKLLVADNVRGVRVIDIAGTIPAMTELGGLEVTTSYSAIAIDGHYFFVVNYNGLRVIDIFNPVSPAHVAKFQTPDASNVIVDAGYALITSKDNLWVLDVSDPLTPTLIGQTAIEMLELHRVEMLGALGGTARIPWAFLADAACNHPSCSASLKVVNLANPAAPQVTSIFDDGNSISSMALAGDYMYACTGNHRDDIFDFVIWDVANPTQPAQVSTTDLYARCRDTVVVGQYAYVTQRNEMLIFDVSDPSAPAEVGSYMPVKPITELVADAGLLYAKNAAQLSVLDISNPVSPTLVESHRLPPRTIGGLEINSLLVEDEFVYSLDNGLTIWRHRDDVLGRTLDAWGQPFSGVTIKADSQAIAVSGISGGYAPTDELFGSRTLSAHIGDYSAWPLTRTVNLDEPAYNQDFYIVAQPISAVIHSGISTTLGYEDTQGLLTEMIFPPDAVGQARAVRLTPTMAFHRGAQQFVGNAFELAATDGMGHDAFGAPVQVSIRYSDLGIRVVDEASLALMVESDGTWVEATSLCQEPQAYIRDLAHNTLDAFICTWGRFALYGETNQFFLPIITN
jgi:hypothetical protein